MSYILVDIEADGPFPGDYSVISSGAVVVEPGLELTFYGELCPISEKWVPDALAVSGYTREQVMTFPAPEGVMRSFADWLGTAVGGRPMFISDNNGSTGSSSTGISTTLPATTFSDSPPPTLAAFTRDWSAIPR